MYIDRLFVLMLFPIDIDTMKTRYLMPPHKIVWLKIFPYFSAKTNNVGTQRTFSLRWFFEHQSHKHAT